MEKTIINSLIIILPLLTSPCRGQTKYSDVEQTSYTVWNTYNVHMSDGTERFELYVHYDVIAQMPVSIKTIIARYTAFLPTYLLDEEIELSFAEALGGFSTLKEARESLLKDWTGEDLVILSGEPVYLELTKTENSLLIKHAPMYRESITDEFIISKNGKITYLKQPEPIERIPYSRKVLLSEYHILFRFILNGEKMDRYFCSQVYLDKDNIELVGVNRRDRIVYIEQKNKNPEYFVLSDLNLEYLTAFKVKSIDEINHIDIYDPGRGWYVTFDKTDKIEKSAIKRINSFMLGNTKFVTFEIKE